MRRRTIRRCDQHGFTFVELMTVPALLSVLIVIAWGKFNTSYEMALSDLTIAPSPRSTIYITDANIGGWAAWNEIEGTARCSASSTPAPASSRPRASPTSSERIECSMP